MKFAWMGLIICVFAVVGFQTTANAQIAFDSRKVSPESGNAFEGTKIRVHNNVIPTRLPRARPRTMREESDIRSAAEDLLRSADRSCDITDTVSIGTSEGNGVYEVVCSRGPGYMLIGSTPTQSFDCTELRGLAMIAQERDPTVEEGLQCVHRGNMNFKRVVADLAAEAGVRCRVDDAAPVGQSFEGNLVYEVGCANTTGWWIEKTQAGWRTTPCWDVLLNEEACRFSTAQEVRAGWAAALANTSAAACGVEQARRVGRDNDGLIVYEVRCSGADGYIARIDQNWVAKQTEPCAEASVQGGCRWSTGPSNSGGQIS